MRCLFALAAVDGGSRPPKRRTPPHRDELRVDRADLVALRVAHSGICRACRDADPAHCSAGRTGRETARAVDHPISTTASPPTAASPRFPALAPREQDENADEVQGEVRQHHGLHRCPQAAGSAATSEHRHQPGGRQQLIEAGRGCEKSRRDGGRITSIANRSANPPRNSVAALAVVIDVITRLPQPRPRRGPSERPEG